MIGLVDGGERIRRMDWKSVRGWLHVVRYHVYIFMQNRLMVTQ